MQERLLEKKNILTAFHLTYSSPLYFALFQKISIRQLNHNYFATVTAISVV